MNSQKPSFFSGYRNTNAGIALVMVLWILSLLTIIASSFAFSTRTDTQLMSNLVGLARAQAMADAGIHRAIYSLAIPSTDPARWQGDGRDHLWDFQDETVRITIRDESGKIDLNSAHDDLLRGLFRYGGLNEQGIAQLLDAVLDWRDEDSLRRANGAEAAEYSAAGLLYTPANTRFQTVGELRQVLGMTETLYRRIAGLITVYSGQTGINSAIAPREVLLALPGVNPAQVDAYIATREAVIPGQPVPAFPFAQAFSTGESNAFSIRAEARLKDGSVFVREAVVRLQQDAKSPVSFLAWRAPDLYKRPDDGGSISQREQNGK